jgi:hypothetical protein
MRFTSDEPMRASGQSECFPRRESVRGGTRQLSELGCNFPAVMGAELAFGGVGANCWPGEREVQKRGCKRAIFQMPAADLAGSEEVMRKAEVRGGSDWFFAGYDDFSHDFTHFSPPFSDVSDLCLDSCVNHMGINDTPLRISECELRINNKKQRSEGANYCQLRIKN